MKEDPSSLFSQPEFKESLARYENMLLTGIHAYFEPEELTLLAEYYAEQDDPDSSDQVIEYAMKLYPENLDIQIYKCHSLLSLRKLEAAKELLRALPDQNDYEVQLLYAELSIADDDLYPAEQRIATLYEQNPYIGTMLDIAQMYVDYQLYNYAYPWIQQAFAQEPDNLEAIELMAIFHYYSTKNFEEASRLFNKVLDESPYNLMAWQNLARCYLRMNELEKAADAIDFAITVDEIHPINIELKGEYYLAADYTEEAASCFNYFAELSHDKANAYYLAMNLFFEAYDFAYALRYSDYFLDKQDLLGTQFNYADIYHLYAFCCIRLEKEQECAGIVDKCLASYPDDYRFYMLKGELELTMDNNGDKAMEYFMHAIRLNPGNDQLLPNAALIFLDKQHYSESQHLFLSLNEKYPKIALNFSYFVAFNYYKMDAPEKMYPYLVRGSIYSPKVLSELKDFFVQDGDTHFYDTAKEINRMVKSGELDPTPYLPTNQKK